VTVPSSRGGAGSALVIRATMEASPAGLPPSRDTSMTDHVALLRAVNVAGHKQVAMADLRSLLAQLGLADPRSLLQSGNLLFRAAAQPSARLERLLETEAKKRLGLESAFFVRSAEEWRALVAHNPFRDEARRDPGRLVAVALKEAPPPKSVAALQAAIKDSEVVRAGDRHIYAVYPDGIGRSRLTNSLIEKMLGTRATARNWNTVLKLAATLAG
jgi:uncharacterized protein (DUF1697 family)